MDIYSWSGVSTCLNHTILIRYRYGTLVLFHMNQSINRAKSSHTIWFWAVIWLGVRKNFMPYLGIRCISYCVDHTIWMDNVLIEFLILVLQPLPLSIYLEMLKMKPKLPKLPKLKLDLLDWNQDQIWLWLVYSKCTRGVELSLNNH